MEKNTAQSRVTSLAEVWIEICRYLFLIIPHLSLPLRKCGLKWLSLSGNRLLFCHFPCGSVDWNICEVGVGVGVWVTSLAEVWIEILSRSTYGNPRSKCYHHKYYKDLLKSLDLPDIHFHQLRNTYATILLKNSFNSKGVSHLLGHAKEIISVDVYGDTQEIIEDCLDVLEPFIYWRSYSKRAERSVLWLFRSDWNRLNPGGIFQRSMIKIE